MNDFDLTPDDPRLTAYALGELEGDERALVEAALRQDAGLRDALQDIQATALQIEAALAAESLGPIATPAPAHAREPRFTINDAALTPALPRTGGEMVTFGRPEEAPRAKSAGAKRARPPKLLSFPQAYFLVGGLAAACFVVLSLLQPRPPLPPSAEELAAKAKPVLPSATMAQAAANAPNTVAVGDAAARAAETLMAVPVEISRASEAPVVVAVSEPPTSDATDVALPARVETLAGGLPLLEQAKAVEQAAITQGAATENATPFAPLALQRAPFVLTPPRSTAIGLPQAAAPVLVPPTAEAARAPAASSQAVVRRQDYTDAMRIAELRSTGSEADRARLMAEARRQMEAERNAALSPAPVVLPRDRAPRLVSWARLSPPLGLSGEVRVEFSVDGAGAVQNASVVSAARPALGELVLANMRRWRFEPALKEGRAVGTLMTGTVTFHTSGEAEVALAARSSN